MREFVLQVVVFTFVFLLTSVAALSQQAPKFEAYRVSNIYNGKNARAKLDKDTYMFRTRIRNAARQKRDFAGEYVLAQWGCGASCRIIVAINVRTGNVYGVPFSVCCWTIAPDINPVIYRLNSRLMSFAGLRNESEKDSEDDIHYYELRNGKFRFIKTVKRQ